MAAAPIQTQISLHGAGELGMHRHSRAYAALVLSGSYEERGPDGVWRCEEGDLVVHPAFHMHANTFPSRGARVLNFLLPDDWHCEHPCVVKLAHPSVLAGAKTLHAGMLQAEIDAGASVRAARLGDWRDSFAATLAERPDLQIRALAQSMDLSPGHVTRAFARGFGLRPAAFRAEHQLRRALRLIHRRRSGLAAIAQACGYADQAHMTRSFRKALGITPGQVTACRDQFGSRRRGQAGV